MKEKRDVLKRKTKKKAGKQWLSFMLCMALLLSASENGVWKQIKKAEAASHTQAEAVAWANSQIGKGLDYDGVYGNQCVDLIKYYYAYFDVANYATGNANAYITNALPPGWSRVYGDYQAGDVAVWKTNHSCRTCNTGPLGHVGIITSADEVGFNAVNQNFNNTPSCTQNWFNISALACAIRPAFGSANAELSYSQLKVEFVDNRNVGLYGRIENPGKVRLSQVGVYIWDASGNLVVNHRENCTLATSYVEQRLNVVSEAKADGLKAGTNYTYQMYAIANGKTYYSGKGSFKTTDPISSTSTPVGTPQSTSITSVKSGKKKITITWERVDGIGGYQVSYALNSNFSGAKNKDVTAKNTTVTLKNLKSKKYYFVRIRTFQTVSGKKYYSAWSKISKIKVK